MNPTIIRMTLFGFSLLMFFAVVGEFIAAASFTPAYDWVGNTISHLGATTCTSIVYPLDVVPVCSPEHLLLNSSLVVSGMAMLGIALVGRFTKGFSYWASLLWFVTGMSTMASGLIPLDVSPEWHLFVTTPLYLSMPLAVLAGAIQLQGWVSRVGYGFAIIGLCAGLWLALYAGTQAYDGLLERLVIWPSTLWVALAAIFGHPRPRS
ncbi:DUF998 domain-containing protein [Corynebacterium alimapuense]|uniref:DUF998 domain-containing protein n=1 Tax=Corynebacterium alimapuense TaxID=1576874 RepID=A0A3M8K5F8_9CORY|nr:DUF998 domain-containing protein [Corynebacterium alimapuense]RNE48099.1 hypothetical protein C5L39_09470 [Corynebacterium alimapuense]